MTLSRAGNGGAIWILIAIVAAIRLRRVGPFLLTLASVGVADLIALALKRLTSRPRPSVTYPEPEALVRTPLDLSFPSGHAATSFAAAVVLAAYVPRLAPALFTLAVLIAFSRVYVGVHYPVDVIAGAVLGAAVATALRSLAGRLRRRRRAPRPG